MNNNISQVLEDFCGKYRETSYKKGDVVIRGDDEPNGVYLIKDGIVKMSTISADGNEIAVNIFKSNTFFPMMWAIAGIENNYYFQIVTSAKLVKIPRNEFMEFLRNNPEILFDFTKRLLIGVDGLIFNMTSILDGDSVSRVAVVIHMLAKRFGVNNGEEIMIDLPLTHQDISQFIGLTRETATIAINKLIADGIIIRRERKFVVKKMDDLRNAF